MKQKRIKTLLLGVDEWLVIGRNKVFVWYFLSLAYYLLLFQGNPLVYTSYIINVMTCGFTGLFTVWFYLSSRKYGFIDTTMFCIFVPFSIVSVLLGGHINREAKKDYSGLADFLSTYIHDEVNEIYVGEVIERRSSQDGVFAMLEVPYGLHIPHKDIIHKISSRLYISEKNITYEKISPRKTQYVITPDGLHEYDLNKRSCFPFDTMEDIKDRVFLRMRAYGVNQTLPSESDSNEKYS